MAYGLGRRVGYADQPVVRSIVREAALNDYRVSSFVLGVVMSDAFRMQSPASLSSEISIPDGG